MILKKVHYLGAVRTTLSNGNVWSFHYCALPHGNWYSLYHIIPKDLNHSSLYTKTDSGEQLSSHTSAKQTHISVYSWWKNKAEWCTKSAGMCHLSCGEMSGKQYLNGDTTFNECSLWLVTLDSDWEYKMSLLLTLRLLMSYIYVAPILDVSRSHTTTQHSR